MPNLCSVDGCGKPVKGVGYCQKHYARWRRNGDPTVSRIQRNNGNESCSWCGSKKKIVAKGLCGSCYQRKWKKGYLEYDVHTPKKCSIQGCEKHVLARGWCDSHYERWKRYGNPTHEPVKGRGNREKHSLYPSWHWAKRHKAGVCEEWKEFWSFVEGVGDKPSPQHVLTRIDRERPLGPSNFEWRKKRILMEGDTENEKRADYARKSRLLFPDKERDRNLRKQYGITLSTYERLLEFQKGRCAICAKKETVSIGGGQRRKRKLAVDHCHETGRVRGLLCTNCNKGIGHFKDSTELLENAIRYLHPVKNFIPK